MDIVLRFEPTLQPISVVLPDEQTFYDVLDVLKRAVVDEGKRQIVSIVFRTMTSAQVPPHGVIVFELEDDDDDLNVNAEGPWWLYVKDTRTLRACAIALEVICDVAHVRLTIDD